MYIKLSEFSVKGVKPCSHVPSPKFGPPSFNIVSIVMVHSTGWMSSRLNLPVKVTVTIDTMLRTLTGLILVTVRVNKVLEYTLLSLTLNPVLAQTKDNIKTTLFWGMTIFPLMSFFGFAKRKERSEPMMSIPRYRNHLYRRHRVQETET